MKKLIVAIVLIAAAAGIGYYSYSEYQKEKENRYPKFYSGNGRLEATEVFIASKLPGRIEKLFVDEGSLVRKGDKIVEMQTNKLLAQKASAIAMIKEQEGKLKMAQATVKLKQSSFNGAEKEYKRQSKLVKTNAVSQKAYDSAETTYNNALAELEYAKANVLAAEGLLAKQKAELQSIQADIDDSTLYAKYNGRIQYILAREGEVLSAGGRVMNQVNLTDSYLTFFLPTHVAGQVQMGAEVKIVFDAAPDCAFYANVTYIDPVAQFTPKSVETKVEREKLMFRVKAHLDAALLHQYIADVKTGLPGVAWVKVDPNADWKDAPNSVVATGAAYGTPSRVQKPAPVKKDKAPAKQVKQIKQTNQAKSK